MFIICTFRLVTLFFCTDLQMSVSPSILLCIYSALHIIFKHIKNIHTYMFMLSFPANMADNYVIKMYEYC